MIQGQLVVAPDNLKGFDCNRAISGDQAHRLRQKGYSFAARYVRRTEAHAYDLTSTEAEEILDAGLGLIVVQHVAPPGWVPTFALGGEYGSMAVIEASRRVGLPPGTMIFLDLEEVRSGISSAATIDFCNQWHERVASAGYNPGLYVGYAPGLSASDLYRKLRFAHYWGAYNLNSDNVPVIRGLQMKQQAARAEDLIPPFSTEDFDVDYARADALGGRIQLLTRGWCK